jgi:hypothetical protein
MKGTFISILVGALGGVLLTVGSSVHASHAAASAKHASMDPIAPLEVESRAAAGSAAPPTPPSEQPSARQ